MPKPAHECVVVGYHDMDFRARAAGAKLTAHLWGDHSEVLTNSVLLGEERLTFMELLNHVSARYNLGLPRLNIFHQPNLAVVYLTSFLRRRGIRAVPINFFTEQKDEFRELLQAGTTTVAITTTFYSDNAAISEIIAFVRSIAPETKIVIGGPHAFNLFSDHQDIKTLDFVFRDIGADFYIHDSQGESTLAVLVKALVQGGASADLRAVPNLAHRGRDGSFERTTRRIENNSLDENVVDWDHIDPSCYRRTAYVRTARSCPFACGFCSYPTLAGQHVLSDVSTVEKELRQLESLGFENITFVDDTFNVPLPRFKKLLQMMIGNRFPFRWMSFLRCSNVDEEAFDLMAESGCKAVFLGIESGDQQILNNMNKFAKTERYLSGIEALADRQIATYASFVIGFPGESQATLANTRDFIKGSKLTFVNPQLYYHDLKSPVQRDAAKYGIKGAGYNWRHNTMDWREAAQGAQQMFRETIGPVPVTSYGFGAWGLFYLLEQGISFEQQLHFGRIASSMLAASLDDVAKDFTRELEAIAAIFGGGHDSQKSAQNIGASA